MCLLSQSCLESLSVLLAGELLAFSHSYHDTYSTQILKQHEGNQPTCTSCADATSLDYGCPESVLGWFCLGENWFVWQWS